MANVELATAYVTLIPSMQGAQGKIAEALMPAGAEGEKAGKNAGGMFAGGFGGVLGAAAIGVAATGAAVAGASVGLYKVGAVFDDVTDTIRIGTGASGDALNGLVDIAKQVGTSVPTDFATAGSVVADLNTRLGLSGDTLSTVAQQYIQAGNILGETVDVNSTTAAFSAFGIEGAKVEGAMDTLFQVSQATGVGMNELASTVQANAAPMKNLGFSFEETAALAGSLDKAGLNTSQTMASMSKGLVTLAKAGEEPEAAFKRTTGEIGEFIKSGDTAGALNLASKVFGTRGASQFVGALQSGKINLDDLTASAGMTSDTILGLGKETADAGEQWQMIKSKALLALEPMGTAIYNLAGQGLGFLNERMDGVTGKISEFGDGVAGVIGILTKGDFSGPIFGMEEDSGFVDFLFNVRDAVLDLVGAFKSGNGAAGIADFFAGIINGGAGLRDGLISAIGAAIPKVVGAIVAAAPAILGAAVQSFSSLVTAVIATVPPLLTALLGMMPVIIPALLGMIPTILDAGLQLFAGLADAVMQALPQVISTLVAILPQIADAIVGMLPMIVQAGLDLFMGLVQSVMQLLPILIDAVVGLLPSITSTLLGMLPQIIDSALSLFLGVVIGLLSAAPSIISALVGVLPQLVSALVGMIPQLMQAAVQLFTGIVAAIPVILPQLIGAVIQIGPTLVSTLIGMVPMLAGAGVSLIGGLVQGLWRSAGSVGQALLGIAGSAIEGFKDFLGIRSPSRVFAGYGVNIGQGLINGMDGMHGKISSSVEGMVTVPAVPAFGPTANAGSPVDGEAGSGGAAQGNAIERIVLDVGGEQVFARIVRNGERKLVRA